MTRVVRDGISCEHTSVVNVLGSHGSLPCARQARLDTPPDFRQDLPKADRHGVDPGLPMSLSGKALRRHLRLACLLWLACVAELGWEMWTTMRVAPRFLELFTVAVCLFASSRTIVFWSGMTGLLHGLLYTESLVANVAVFGTVGLVGAWRRPTEVGRTQMLSLSLRSIVLLVLLVVGHHLANRVQLFPDRDLWRFELLAAVCLTWLAILPVCFIGTIRHKKLVWGPEHA